MDLAEFHTLLDDFADEGGVQETRIPTVVRQSVLFLERNNNFEYMKAQQTVTFAMSEDPVAVDLGLYVKTILSGEVRTLGTTAGIKPVAFTRDPHAVLDDEEFEGKLPVLMYVDNLGSTWIKSLLALSADIDIHIHFVKRTSDWPVVSFGGYSHPLIDRAEDVLLARSVIQLASVTKDPELKEFYQTQYQEGLKSLLDSDFAFSIEE